VPTSTPRMRQEGVRAHPAWQAALADARLLQGIVSRVVIKEAVCFVPGGRRALTPTTKDAQAGLAHAPSSAETCRSLYVWLCKARRSQERLSSE
jgi:hypothetical protein